MHSNSKCYQTWMVKELEEKKKKKKNCFDYFDITNNFVEKCLKMPHVNSLSRITVRSSTWSFTEINSELLQGLAKKPKQTNKNIGSFALSLTNNAILITRVVVSFMFSILPNEILFPL